MKGVVDLLEVFEDRIAITPKGFHGFMIKGLKGTKEIPYYSITAIQMKEPGKFTRGYIQFTISGGKENQAGLMEAVDDENTFLFSDDHSLDLVRKVKAYIATSVRKAHAPSGSGVQPASLPDEIVKLASLRDQGLLSESEFLAAKAKLLA